MILVSYNSKCWGTIECELYILLLNLCCELRYGVYSGDDDTASLSVNSLKITFDNEYPSYSVYWSRTWCWLNCATLDYVYFYTDTGHYMIVCAIQRILHAGKIYATTYILCLYLGLEYGLLKDKRNYKSF